MFSETKIYFPDQLEHQYEDLLKFNRQLTKERNKLLKQTLQEKKSELKEINLQLQNLNKQRGELLIYLQDTEVFEKFKYLQKGLVKIEGESLKLQDKLEVIDSLIEKQEENNDLLKEIEETVEELKKAYKNTGTNKKYSLIRKLFSSYYKNIMNKGFLIKTSQVSKKRKFG